ncbi:recombinase family protein [Streptosporangium carneum]|uniref:Resolvase/invertase-type recombinase catalytic domain-containing protein n=1 Tax=Streptosporangium carneum TaxID=47481 RepID=A0A9W6MCD1_9ACTN|nr:recombinase family protein [Streptosporangium carneum]GLK09309.1 hypothetical protein GCM10017600_27150 [Streptosporangium carneum]
MCRIQGGKVAPKYYTARFVLVPALREVLEVAVPANRLPGRPWTQAPPVQTAVPEAGGQAVRIGYARCSTAQQELASQIEALEKAGCSRIFSEKISTRIKVRPEFETALKLCTDTKAAVPAQAVILVVQEMKRLARNHIREKTLGPPGSRGQGNHSGRPKVFDEDMLTFALALRDRGVSVPNIETGIDSYRLAPDPSQKRASQLIRLQAY